MIQFWSITRNTFVQTIRQPIFVVLIFACFLMLVLSLPLAGWTMESDIEESDQRFLVNIGLSSLLLMGIVIAAFSASTAVGKEIEDRTALTVISKPVHRYLFVLGKFAGVALAVTGAYVIMLLGAILLFRHQVVSTVRVPTDWPVIVLGTLALLGALLGAAVGNYMFKWTFTSTLVLNLLIGLGLAVTAVAFLGKDFTPRAPGWTFGEQGTITPDIGKVMLTTWMAVMLLTAVATAASTRLGQVATLLITIGVLVVGSMHPALFERLSAETAGGRQTPVIQALGGILPDLTRFYFLDALAGKADRAVIIPWTVVQTTGLYFLSYTAAMLALAVGLFQTRPMEVSEGSSSVPSAVSLLSGFGRLAAVAMGLIALILATQPKYWAPGSLGILGGVLLAALGSWMLWTAFSAGRRWAWVVSLLLAGLAVGWGVTVFWIPGGERLSLGLPLSRILQALLIGLLVMLGLLLPKTRHHFRSPVRSAVLAGD